MLLVLLKAFPLLRPRSMLGLTSMTHPSSSRSSKYRYIRFQREKKKQDGESQMPNPRGSKWSSTNRRMAFLWLRTSFVWSLRISQARCFDLSLSPRGRFFLCLRYHFVFALTCARGLAWHTDPLMGWVTGVNRSTGGRDMSGYTTKQTHSTDLSSEAINHQRQNNNVSDVDFLF